MPPITRLEQARHGAAVTQHPGQRGAARSAIAARRDQLRKGLAYSFAVCCLLGCQWFACSGCAVGCRRVEFVGRSNLVRLHRLSARLSLGCSPVAACSSVGLVSHQAVSASDCSASGGSLIRLLAIGDVVCWRLCVVRRFPGRNVQDWNAKAPPDFALLAGCLRSGFPP